MPIPLSKDPPMHISSRVTCALAAAVCVLSTAHPTTAPGKSFDLTVDSIMRGPKLVGYPQTGMRWSGDSARLYFEWRRPGDDEAATYVVGRDGGEPRKLSDDERRQAPPVNGRWDKGHRRALFVDQGDIVLVDSVANTRRQITRMTGSESNPRWARRESAVTFTRDNNLFLVPLENGAIEQLTDVQAKKREPRETDSQKFIKAEDQKIIEHTRVEAERKKKAEEKDKARALPKFELAERQSVIDSQLSPDGTHVFLLVSERTDAAKRPNVPNYVTESSYTEDIPARTFVGDAQDKRTLAVLNLQTGKTVLVDGSFAGKVRLKPDATEEVRLKPDATDAGTGGVRLQPDRDPQTREVRWSMPIVNEDGTLVVANARGRQQRPLAGRHRFRERQRARDRQAPRRWVGARGWHLRRTRAERVRMAAGSEASLVPVGARRLDAPLHSRRERGERGRAAADAGEVGDRIGGSVGRREEVLLHQHRSASRRASPLLDVHRRRHAHADHVDDRRQRQRSVTRRQHHRLDLLGHHEAARNLPDAEPCRRRRETADDDADR